ncbi:MAG: hypothetical protein OSB09_07410 [Planctomycetota bacterium]|nr:hypothetical protein [Planctomycetota bacterium]
MIFSPAADLAQRVQFRKSRDIPRCDARAIDVAKEKLPIEPLASGSTGGERGMERTTAPQAALLRLSNSLALTTRRLLRFAVE